MNFTFDDDQLAYRDAVDAMLQGEVTADRIRARWETSTGIDEALVAQVQALGLGSMLVPESLGGLGLGAVDFILLAEACGRVALPEAVVDSVMVATPLLVDVLDRGLGNGSVQRVIEGLCAGDLSVGVGHPINPCINFADSTDWLLLARGEALYLVPTDQVELHAVKSVDPSRRLFEVSFEPNPEHRIADGDAGATLWRSTLNRGALATAAVLLGLADGIVRQCVQYSSDRQQFGRPIGANQAVKHLMADVAVQMEYARPVIHRAAYTVGVAPTRADFAVSHAKVVAARAALLAGRNGIQVHGAMGYTWECDLHIWVKRAWALTREYGGEGFHKNRIHQWLQQPNALLGPEFTFGRGSLLDSTAA
jgi:alkylation response protein AidB-like acyl-CoA dehydrogenase